MLCYLSPEAIKTARTVVIVCRLSAPTSAIESPRSGSIAAVKPTKPRPLSKGYNAFDQLPSREVLHLRAYSLNMDPDPPAAVAPASPPIWRWVVSFLAVGACWGLTTPFMRRAAVVRDQQPKPQRPYLTSDAPWWKCKFWSILYAVIDLLKNPAYAVPLLLNVTGSVWFFLLIGQAGENHVAV